MIAKQPISCGEWCNFALVAAGIVSLILMGCAAVGNELCFEGRVLDPATNVCHQESR